MTLFAVKCSETCYNLYFRGFGGRLEFLGTFSDNDIVQDWFSQGLNIEN